MVLNSSLLFVFVVGSLTTLRSAVSAVAGLLFPAWPSTLMLTLTFKLDLDIVKPNHHARCLGQRSSSSKDVDARDTSFGVAYLSFIKLKKVQKSAGKRAQVVIHFGLFWLWFDLFFIFRASQAVIFLPCCRSETCCTRLAANTKRKNDTKNAISAASHKFVGLYLRN